MIEWWMVVALGSAVLFAFRDLLMKRVFSHHEHPNPNHFLVVEYLLALIIVIGLFLPSVDFHSFVSLWPFYLLKAFSVALAGWLYFYLLEDHEISLVAPLINLSPLVLLVLSTVILGEVVTLVQFLGILVIIGATYLLEMTRHQHRESHRHLPHFGVLLRKDGKFFIQVIILLLSLSFAAISDKFILNEVSVYSNMFFTALLILLVMGVYYLKKMHLQSLVQFIKREPTALVASLFSALSLFLVLFAIAAPGALVSLIIPLRRTATLYSSLFGGLLFHEDHLRKKLLATMAMLLGIVLIVL